MKRKTIERALSQENWLYFATSFSFCWQRFPYGDEIATPATRMFRGGFGFESMANLQKKCNN